MLDDSEDNHILDPDLRSEFIHGLIELHSYLNDPARPFTFTCAIRGPHMIFEASPDEFPTTPHYLLDQSFTDHTINRVSWRVRFREWIVRGLDRLAGWITPKEHE